MRGGCALWPVIAAVFQALAFGSDTPYVVGPNVQVSLDLATVQHYETQIAADPARPRHLVACAYVIRPGQSSDNVFYASFDGGRTWKHTLTVPDSVDPSCAIGLKHAAFAAGIHDVKQADGSSPSFLDVRRSADGGRTWRESSIRTDTRSFDRTYLTVDDSRGPFHGRVYVHGYLQRPPAAFAFYPSLTGESFDRAIVQAAAVFAKPWFFPANGVVSSDGVFAALFVELDNTRRNMSYRTDPGAAPTEVNGALQIVYSRDGGQTLEPAAKIADIYYDWRVPQLSMASLAVDRGSSSFRGRMYAAWPGAGPGQRTQIFFSCSTSDGKWSAPRVVSDDAASLPAEFMPNNFMPVVAVNRSGVVGLSWYDRRDNPDDLGYQVRFSASLDGGATWLPSVRVSTHGNLVNAAEHDTRYNGGDTAGLTADAAGVFHPLWIDNRTGVHQMWTAAIRVRQPSRR
ncbi:MAG TPA: hypothetical protein VKR61_02730 [Bryobacteraceae bacterium]|nr:hypothetical protein [Bryobacteraceae bacterium]